MSKSQLCLNLQLRNEANFENFLSTKVNEALLHHLKNLFNHDDNLYIWSASQQGRTHLLQALCQLAQTQHYNPMYLSLKKTNEMESTIFENLEHYDLICLDDIEGIIGNTIWEEALFHLYNRIQIQGKKIVVTANAAPIQLNFSLPDLKSRLSACTVFTIQPLSDSEKITLLQMRAKQKGLLLSTQVGKFLLDHVSRDNNSLFEMLEQLDQASLAEKHALTIPFIKQVLAL